MLKLVTQEETTSCGIAAVANILGKSYAEIRVIADRMGIHAEDRRLWSDTQYVRHILTAHGVQTADDENDNR